jgi:hypothetical protein
MMDGDLRPLPNTAKVGPGAPPTPDEMAR